MQTKPDGVGWRDDGGRGGVSISAHSSLNGTVPEREGLGSDLPY